MAKKILVSLHGNRVGLDTDGNLVIDDTQVTNLGQAEGAKNGSTVTLTEEAHGPFRKVKLTCAATPISFADDAGNGQYGGVKLYDFPAGLLCFMGAVISGDLTLTEAAWIDTFDGDVALGTAVADDGQGQDGTTADLLQTAAITQAVAQVAEVESVTIATALTESGARWHDGTTTAKDLFLNFEIDDNAAHAAGNGTFTGTVEFIYAIIGDND